MADWKWEARDWPKKGTRSTLCVLRRLHSPADAFAAMFGESTTNAAVSPIVELAEPAKRPKPAEYLPLTGPVGDCEADENEGEAWSRDERNECNQAQRKYAPSNEVSTHNCRNLQQQTSLSRMVDALDAPFLVRLSSAASSQVHSRNSAFY